MTVRKKNLISETGKVQRNFRESVIPNMGKTKDNEQ